MDKWEQGGLCSSQVRERGGGSYGSGPLDFLYEWVNWRTVAFFPFALFLFALTGTSGEFPSLSPSRQGMTASKTASKRVTPHALLPQLDWIAGKVLYFTRTHHASLHDPIAPIW